MHGDARGERDCEDCQQGYMKSWYTFLLTIVCSCSKSSLHHVKFKKSKDTRTSWGEMAGYLLIIARHHVVRPPDLVGLSRFDPNPNTMQHMIWLDKFPSKSFSLM
jgi:hypothetical protein